MIYPVGNEDIACGIHEHIRWREQAGLCGRSAVAGKTGSAIARDGGDDARGCLDLADAVIVEIDDVQIAPGTHEYLHRRAEASLGGGPAIAGRAFFPGAGDGGDDAPGCIYPADAVVA